MEFLATFPIFAIENTTRQHAELLGAEHPDTNQKIVFVFTEEAGAQKLADQLGQYRVVKLADDPDGFKQVVSQIDKEIVAFDPVVIGDHLQVKFQARVSTILRRQ
jgi:hypothetical protein